MQPILSILGLRPKPLEEGPRYASLNDRCLASAIDLLLMLMLLGHLTGFMTDAVYAAYGMPSPNAMPVAANFQQFAELIWQTRFPWLISNVMTVLMMGLVYVSCQHAYGTTPGKWLFGLRIVDATTLEPIQGWRYGLRFLGYIPSAGPMMLGVFAGIFSKRKRALHDVIAHTVVLYTRPKGWALQKIKDGYRWLKAKITGSRPVK